MLIAAQSFTSPPLKALKNIKSFTVVHSIRKTKALVPFSIAVGIINIPAEKELISAMEEMRDKPLKSA